MVYIKTLLITLNAKYIHSSLALRYLQAYCSEGCGEVGIKEYTINNKLLNILSDVYKEKPDIIGVACYIWNIEMTMSLIRLIKKVLPHTVVIVGGPEVSYDPAVIMQEQPDIDYLIQGEGEVVLKALLRALAGHGTVDSIDGLAFRTDGGQVMINGTSQTVACLDEVPFPYTESSMKELKDKIIYYESTRGCPFNCQYCLSSATAGVRFRSLELVYEELTFFIKHNVRQVKFVDRTFNAAKRHYLPIMHFLSRQECGTNFHFEIAVDLLDEEDICFLKDVKEGRFQFEIGIQSTNEPTLQAINRTNHWDKITRNVAGLRAGDNIHLHLDLIAGLPEESYWQFGQSFNQVYQLKPHMVQLGFLKMLKGAGIRKNAQKYNYIYADYAPYEVLANSSISYKELSRLKILEGLVDQFYNSGRFQYVLPFLIEQYGGDAFAFFHSLTVYWENRQYNMIDHSVKACYQHLINFYNEQNPVALPELLKELLKFNALMVEGGSVRPEFLSWDDSWEQEKTEFWRSTETVLKYIPDYHFTTWRELKKHYHIEVFTFNVAKYFSQPQAMQQELTPILISYKTKTSYQIIDRQDFCLEKRSK